MGIGAFGRNVGLRGAGDHAGPTPEVPDVSVVMVNWNTLTLTTSAVHSLRERIQGVSYELILIDNGSNADASARELPRRLPWARFIGNPGNVGFSRANNQGIALARGRFVLLLNCDTVQTEDAVGRAVRYLEEHADVGALGILHRNMDAAHTPQASAFPFPNPWHEIRALIVPRFGTNDRFTLHPAELRASDVDWVCGSFLMIRRRCLEAVGPLDERFFSYDEDIDWCRRAWRAGWKVRFWPDVSMLHLGSAAALYLPDKRLAMFRSRLSYYRKHHTAVAAICYYLAAAARLAGAVVKQGLRLALGRASRADLSDRWRRFRWFCALRSEPPPT
jgi:GT2 family glycosyltransferase